LSAADRLKSYEFFEGHQRHDLCNPSLHKFRKESQMKNGLGRKTKILFATSLLTLGALQSTEAAPSLAVTTSNCAPDGYTPIRTTAEFISLVRGGGHNQENFILCNDLDFSTPVDIIWGSLDYAGHFEGNGKTVRNLQADHGLFWFLSGRISNLKVENFQIGGRYRNDRDSILVGLLRDGGTIENVHIRNSSLSNGVSLGALVGTADGGRIIRSSVASTTFNFATGAGLLVGTVYSRGLELRQSTGEKDSQDTYSRPLIYESLYNTQSLRIIDSYGAIPLVYLSHAAQALRFENTYGFCNSIFGCGLSYNGVAINSYVVNLNGNCSSSVGTCRTLSEMTSIPHPSNTYINWDFSSIWSHLAGQLPKLR